MPLQTRRMRRSAVIDRTAFTAPFRACCGRYMWPMWHKLQQWLMKLVLYASALKQVWSWPRNWTIDLCSRDCQSIEMRIRIKVVSHFEPRGKLNYTIHASGKYYRQINWHVSLSLRAMRLAAALTRTISRGSITWREFPVIKGRKSLGFPSENSLHF